MCGRYTLHRERDEIIRIVQPELWADADDYRPSYNIAPTTPCLVLTADARGRELSHMRWGLIPGWARQPRHDRPLINARRETVGEKPSFRHLFSQRHCAVLMDGYFEWRHEGDRRLPYLVRRPDHALLFAAGLWDQWTSPQNEVVRSFVIVTAPAAPSIAALHDRMPALIPDADLDHWLRPGAPAAATVPDTWTGELTLSPVSPALNKTTNDTPELLQPPPTQPELGL